MRSVRSGIFRYALSFIAADFVSLACRLGYLCCRCGDFSGNLSKRYPIHRLAARSHGKMNSINSLFGLVTINCSGWKRYYCMAC